MNTAPTLSETNLNAWKHATAEIVRAVHTRRAQHAQGDHSLCLRGCCDTMPRVTTILSLQAQAELLKAREIVASVPTASERIETAYRQDLVAILAQPRRDVIAEREAADKARRKARGRTEWYEALDVA